ncbi:MAG: NADH:flavin oxidoreductase [Deltaproteobacteria bacterium]|nr:NADH:flavin oxidoreductase [Deltaproteobacteria bacterium]MBW2359563.1 NADH:flavin oxidoreductase [Deltaproteobacteria bacterium]
MSAAPDPFAPTRLGPVELRNRIIRAATFEGMTGDQTVSDRLLAFHRSMARGGVGMTTVAFCAVSPEGAGTPNELILRDQVVPGLRKLADAVHAEGAAVSAQIGHAGAVAASAGIPATAPSAFFSPLAMKRTREATPADIQQIIGDFAAGAKRLLAAGFDAVEVHLGHGYLASEFLSPKINRRRDSWGGSLENRARFSREIAKAVREAVGDRMAVLGKLNMADGVPGGLWLDESIEVARMLQADGALDALELTGGSSLQNPMYLFRGEAPVHEMAQAMPKAVALGLKLFGRFFFKAYPFEEGYFRAYARQFRSALDMPLILLGGINRRDTIEQAMVEGFEFVAMGRALLRDPNLVNQMAKGEADESLCVHCNKCMATIYAGTHCVLVEESQRA